MNIDCYKTRSSAGVIAAEFTYRDCAEKKRIAIPDQWLLNATLEGETGQILRLTYSTAIVEISGRCLEKIYEDARSHKLGEVCVAPPAVREDAKDNELCVTGILVCSPNEVSEDELE